MTQSEYTVLGAESRFDGRPMEKWTEEWWQWAENLPTNGGENPFQDDGSTADLGDRGDVFFLAGIMGSDQDPRPEFAVAERSFEISAGDTILVPALNWFETVPNYRRLPENNDPTANIKDVEQNWVEANKDYVLDAFVYIDRLDDEAGPVKIFDYGDDPSAAENYYVQTGVFSVGKLFEGQLGIDEGGLGPEGKPQAPAMAAGYYAAIQDLSPGTYEVHFGGSFDFNDDEKPDFSVDITDTITIVPSNEFQTAGVYPDYSFG